MESRLVSDWWREEREREKLELLGLLKWTAYIIRPAKSRHTCLKLNVWDFRQRKISTNNNRMIAYRIKMWKLWSCLNINFGWLACFLNNFTNLNKSVKKNEKIDWMSLVSFDCPRKRHRPLENRIRRNNKLLNTLNKYFKTLKTSTKFVAFLTFTFIVYKY